MTPYATPAGHVRALHRISSTPGHNRTLKICCRREPSLPRQRWPGVGRAVTPPDGLLAFEAQTFALVIRRCTPGAMAVYVLVFLCLKRNYGAELQERIAAMLMRLALAAVVPKGTVASCAVEFGEVR